MNEPNYSALSDNLVSLKQNWIKAESWLPNILTSLYKEFQECSEKLLKDDGSGKDRILAQHYYSIAIFYKTLFDQYPINLSTCLKYLKISKSFSKNLTKSDTFVKNCEILTQEIDERCNSLENDFEDMYTIDWIKYCIALGTIDDIELSLLNIHDSVDKEQLLQLRTTIQNLQLLQIINNLEDDLLISANDNICIVFERYNMLSKAYDISGDTKISKQYSDKGESSFDELLRNTDEDYDDNKESINYILKEVKSSIEDELLTLTQIKENITKKNQVEICLNIDEIIIERSYIKYCLKFWYDEVEDFFNTFIETKNCKVIEEISEKIFDVKNLLEIPKHFKNLKYYNLLEKHYKSIPNYIERDYISRLNEDFSDKTRGYLKLLEKECKFFETFFNFLNNIKCFRDVIENLELEQFCKDSLNFNVVIRKILNLSVSNEYQDIYDELKVIANNFQLSNTIFLKEKFQEMIKPYLENVEIQTKNSDDRIYVEVKGKIIIISEILEQLCNKLTDQSVKEVQFIATNTIHIDDNLMKDVWHGINIVILAKKLIVHGSNVVWDVSGIDNNHVYTNNAGTDENGDGKCGANGCPGESGGNVLIEADECENDISFCVVSNGGNGSKGQDGGNGIDGKDGHGISYDDFKTMFPRAAQSFSSANYGKTIDTILPLVTQMVKDEQKDWFLMGHHRYIEAKLQHDNEIVFSYYSSTPLIKHVFLLYKGSLGESGGQGGENGLGGHGGFGGEICADILNIKQISERGKKGDDGNGGLYGNPGKNGFDVAYSDFSPDLTNSWPKPFGKDCQSKLDIKCYNDSGPNRVWCETNKMYIEIDKKEMEPVTSRNFFERRLNSRRYDITQDHDVAAIKKKSISKNDIKERYSHLFEISENEIIKQMKLNMENARTRALQTVCEETEQQVEESVHVNVQRKSNFSVNQKKSNKKKISLQSKFKRNKNYQNILSNINSKEKNDEIQDIDNWYQLKTIPLKYNEIQETLTNFYELKERHSGGIQNEKVIKKLEDIYKILIIKYRFAVFEEIVNKHKFDSYKINEDFSNDLIIRSLREVVKDDRDGRNAISHLELGRLNQYIFDDSPKLRQQFINFLKERKLVYKSELMSSIKKFVLIDEEYERRMPEVNKHFEDYQKFDTERNDNIARIQQEFEIELQRCGLHEKYCENENRPEFEKLLEDQGLSDLYKKLNTELDSKYDWNACILEKPFYKAYEKHIQTKAFSDAYFEILSQLFEANIIICEVNYYNGYEIIKNFNEKSNRKMYLLFLDNKFVELETDKNWKMLLTEQKNVDIIYGEILTKLSSFICPEEFDHYLKNEEFKLLQPNVVKVYTIPTINININDIIEYFSSSNEKKLLKSRLNKIELLSINHSNNQIILENILSRFSYEGRYISINELISIVDDILMSYLWNQKYNVFTWILQAWPQNCWTNEFLILTIENYVKHRLQRKDKIRECLMGIDNKEILLLFKIKLEKLNNQNRVTLECIEHIFYLLSNIDTEIYSLEDLSLNEWPFALKDSYWQSKLKRSLKTDSEDDKNLITTICYNIQQLENTFGKASIDDFLEMVKGKISIPQLEKILKILLRLDNNAWAFDKLINFQNSESIERYIENLDSSYNNNNNVRNISELCEIVSNNANTSKIIISNLSYIENKLYLIHNKSFNFQFIESVDDILKEKDIKSWIKLFKNKFNELPPEDRNSYITKLRFEMLVVIDKGIEIYKKFNLRDTQKLAILSMILNEFECKEIRNTLAQVSTGEGKTFIVLAITIMKALCGQKVDVITSSSVLAKRDADFENKEIYKLFDITVSHNCSESIEKRKKAYSENQVIYGDLGNFQRDYLLDHFYMRNILGDRNFENIIVDEVDSMLLDKGNNMLYISHEICGLDKLESVYIYIWQRINRPARTSEEFMYNFNVKFIKDEILNDIFGVVKLEDIADIDSELDSKQIDKIWKILFDSNIIDGKGKLLVENTITCSNNIEFNDLLKKQELFKYKARIEFLINEKITRETIIHVPNYLYSFIEDHLESWIKSALCALCMQESHNYVVDVDRTETSSDINPNIIIIDNDTGTDQNNSQWDNCLHQFLQLKHGCKLSMQSLKAVFISNVTYLKLYENLYGLTGTLGSEQERDLLKEIHNVNFVTIPTAKPSKFIEFESQICSSEKNWIEEIVTNTKEMIKGDQQSVLIICETVENVRKISKAFAGGDVIPENLHTYTRDFEEFSVAKEHFKLDGGHVIVATNLAGRGTDIKISDELNKSGGLHVCLTYLPANERIEQQAFGRAARKGERGSGILIIQNSEIKLTGGTNFEVVYDLKQKRDFEELHRVSEIKSYYDNHIVHEENCFQKFQEQYKNLRSLLDEKQIHKDIKSILLGATLDRWAFWLDENNKLIKDFSDNEIKLRFDESIDNFITKLECLCCDKYSEWVNDFPVQAIRLGITLLELNKDYLSAICLFDEIIGNEPKFCEAAHYFKGYALKIQNQAPYNLVEEELMSAAKLFEKHSNNAACASAIINKMKERNKCHFVQSDAFIKQKENICNIYNKFIDSIDYILGHRMTSEKFTNATKISDELAELLFNDMLSNGILLKPKISHNNAKDIEKISLNYGISFDILDDLIMEMGDGVIDNMKDFQEILETSILLPSREDFWQKLIDKKILTNEIEYVVIDIEKLKSIDSVLADTIAFKIRYKEFNKQTFTNVHNIRLILYSEQINQENTMILKRDDFLNIVEFDKYETLLRVGVFSLNKSANMKVDREFFFDMFDSVSVNDIAKENITLTEANTIFEILIEENIIRQVKGVHRLAIPYYDLNKINLNGYSIYKNSVVALLNLSFIYRIALEKVYNDLNNQRNNTQISLMAQPHRQLIFDLIEKNIIMPASVKINIDYKKRLKSIYNENFDHYRSELKNEASLTLIAEILEQSGRKLESKRSWHLKPILELFGRNNYGNVQEIHMFSLNGLQHIVDLEQKWSWKMLVNCFIVILIGLASIVVGSLFEMFSAGVLSFEGLAFLGEGINDITFAISALSSGYFTWKDYGKHKARSSLLTVIAAGVGVFLTKAFRLGRFGYRVSGTSMTNIEDMPNRNSYGRLLQSTLNEIRSGIENGSFRGRTTDTITSDVNVSSNRIIYNDVEKLMKNITSGMLDNIGNVILNHNMPSVFDKTFEILGREKTRNLIDEITELYLSKPYLFDRLLPITRKLTNCMEKIVTEASSIKNFGKKVMSSEVSAIDVVDEVLKWTTKAKDIEEIREMINDILIDLNSEINSKCNNVVVKSVTVTNTKILKDFKQEVFQNWKKELQDKIRQILTQKMLNPVLENANKTLNQSNEKNLGKSVQCKNDKETKLKYYMKFGKLKKAYIKILEPKIAKEHKMYVDNYIIQKYQRILMLLLAKFKSSKLFAAIISENVPMDFVCLKTCTIMIPYMLKEVYNIDVEGIKIIVKQDNGLTHEFCSVAEGEALTVTFELSKDYFPLENDDSENSLTDLSLSNKNVGNDCLFNALLLHFTEKISNTTIGELRNNFANFIQNYERTKCVLEDSYYWLKSKKSNQMSKDLESGQSSAGRIKKNCNGSKINTTTGEFRNNFANFIQNYEWAKCALEDSYYWLKSKKSNQMSKDPESGQSSAGRIMKNFNGNKNKAGNQLDSLPGTSKSFRKEKNIFEKIWSYMP